MPPWPSSLLFAVLVVTIPYTLILKILLRLPKAIALSHRRWPMPVSMGVIGGITAYATIFIRSAYYSRGQTPSTVLMEFVIAALVYAFGLALILRQFSGLYSEFFVTTGRTGLSLRKTAYRNVVGIDELNRSHGESDLRVETNYGRTVRLTLPTQHVASLYERVKQPL